MNTKGILEFKIEIVWSNPVIWRQIQVPKNYSFYDLHCAIQDAMGWEDLHMFKFITPYKLSNNFGIPDKSWPESNLLPAWEARIAGYFNSVGKDILYTYDFGDNWEHGITLVNIIEGGSLEKPNIIAGENACPLEDIGGIQSYLEIVEISRNKNAPEFEEIRDLLDSHGIKWPIQYGKFSMKKVFFHDPKVKLKLLKEDFELD